VGFGSFFVLINQGLSLPDASPLWILGVARVGSMLTLFLVSRMGRLSAPWPARRAVPVAIVGVLDTLATVALIYALTRGNLGVVAVLSAQYPVLTVVMARVILHDAPDEPVKIGGFAVVAQHVIHPGPTVGYRISADGASVAYLPDHEPALGARRFPEEPRWTSGFDLAYGVDLLIHDGQYSDDERAARVGWGHSSVTEAVAFAELAKAHRLVLFHHDPSHSDSMLDELTAQARAYAARIEVVAGREGDRYDLQVA